MKGTSRAPASRIRIRSTYPDAAVVAVGGTAGRFVGD
jgi:hypothetical protein